MLTAAERQRKAFEKCIAKMVVSEVIRNLQRSHKGFANFDLGQVVTAVERQRKAFEKCALQRRFGFYTLYDSNEQKLLRNVEVVLVVVSVVFSHAQNI